MGNPNLVRKVIDNPAGGAGEVSFPQVVDATSRGQNYLVNANFDVWQRGQTVAVSTGNTYLADRWNSYKPGGTANFTQQRDTDIPVGLEFPARYSWKITCTATGTPTSSGLIFQQRIEGQIVRRLRTGNATVSFWLKTNKSGTYTVRLAQNFFVNSYIVPFTVDTTELNIWVQKSVTVPLNTAPSTWVDSEFTGLVLEICMASHSSYQGAANTWLSGSNVAGVSGMVNFGDSTSNALWIAQPQIVAGDEAKPFSLFAGDIVGEIEACERYFQTSGNSLDSGASSGDLHYVAASNGEFDHFFPFRTRMRASPSVTTFGTSIAVTSAISTGWYNSSSTGAGIQNITIGWQADAELTS